MNEQDTQLPWDTIEDVELDMAQPPPAVETAGNHSRGRVCHIEAAVTVDATGTNALLPQWSQAGASA